VCLVQSKEAKLERDEALKILPNLNKVDDVEINIIGMHFQGNNSTARCQQVNFILNRMNIVTTALIIFYFNRLLVK